MQKFSTFITEAEKLPDGHRWIHHGVTMSKGNQDGNQRFKRVTFSTAHKDHPNIAQPDGKYGPILHPSAIGAMVSKHEKVRQLKKDGWTVSQRGTTSSLNKKHVVKAFDDHEKHHRSTFSRPGYKRPATNSYNLEK